MKFVYSILNNFAETVYSPLSFVMDGKDGVGLHFGKILPEFLIIVVPISRKNQEYTMDYSSCKKLIEILVLNSRQCFWSW